MGDLSSKNRDNQFLAILNLDVDRFNQDNYVKECFSQIFNGNIQNENAIIKLTHAMEISIIEKHLNESIVLTKLFNDSIALSKSLPLTILEKKMYLYRYAKKYSSIKTIKTTSYSIIYNCS